MRRLILPLLLLVLAGCEGTIDSDPVFQITGVPLFDTWIPHDRYVSMLSNRWSDEEVPVQIYLDGSKFEGTVEPQGAGSRYHVRWSYKLELADGQTINGLRESNLSAQIFDNTHLRTTLAVHAFGALGFPTIAAYPIYLRINGAAKGLYQQVERIDEDYFRRRGMPVHELIKCGFGSRFTFEGGNDLEDTFERVLPESGNLNDFGDFLHALDTADPDRLYEQVSPFLDINQYLRYHALSSILNHVDGFSNNLYFYRPAPGSPYTIIPWDFDKLLYGADDVGLAGDNEIIRKLLQNDSCVAVYKREAYRALDVALADAELNPLLDSTISRIAEAFRQDPWLGGAGISLPDESNRLKMYLTRRKDYFRQHLETIKRYPR